MRRWSIGVAVVAGLVVCALGAGYSRASSDGHWVVTDVAALAGQAFPSFTGITLLGMTADGRVLWTAYEPDKGQSVRDVFQWQNGTMSDLGTLPNNMSRIVMNGRGDLAGSDLFIPTMPPRGFHFPPTHGYLWQRGKVTPLGALGYGTGGVAGINNHDQIAEAGAIGTSYRVRALLWQNGKVTVLGTLGGIESGADGINDRGQVVGESDLKNRQVRGVLWQQGKMTPIGPPATTYVSLAVNERGQVVGSFYAHGGGTAHVFLWQNEKTTDLGPTNNPYTIRMNDRAQVIGTRQPRSDVTRGLLWQNGKATDLGTLGGPSTWPIAINNSGQIVGVSTLRGSTDQDPKLSAFVWQNGKIARLPGPNAFPDAPMAIDPTGTHIALSTSLDSCIAPDDCGGHLLLWTLHP
jgi:probable HAF family extracellular repeat protein